MCSLCDSKYFSFSPFSGSNCGGVSRLPMNGWPCADFLLPPQHQFWTAHLSESVSICLRSLMSPVSRKSTHSCVTAIPSAERMKAKQKSYGSKSLTSLTMEGWWVKGEGWRVKEGRRNLASCQVRPLSAATRRHFGAELRTIKASASTLPHPMIPWSQWSCLCMNLDVKRNSTLQYSFGLCTAQVFVAHHKTVTWKTLKNYESICCQVTGTWQSKVQDSNRTPMHSTCNVCSLNRL